MVGVPAVRMRAIAADALLPLRRRPPRLTGCRSPTPSRCCCRTRCTQHSPAPNRSATVAVVVVVVVAAVPAAVGRSDTDTRRVPLQGLRNPSSLDRTANQTPAAVGKMQRCHA